MTVRDALNSALDEEMSADPKVFLMGEEVRTVGKKLVFPGFDVRSFFLCSCFIFWAQVGEYQGFKVHTRLDFNIWRDEFVDLYSCEDQMSTLYICQSALYLQFCIDIQRLLGKYGPERVLDTPITEVISVWLALYLLVHWLLLYLVK